MFAFDKRTPVAQRWHWCVALLAGYLVLTTACKSPKSGDPVVEISGVVRDSISKAPIDSAQVCFFEHTTVITCRYSTSTGRYGYSSIGTGEFTIRCVKDGYATKSIIVNATPRHLRFDSVNFELNSGP